MPTASPNHEGMISVLRHISPQGDSDLRQGGFCIHRQLTTWMYKLAIQVQDSYLSRFSCRRPPKALL
jgi:hypothetical protein